MATSRLHRLGLLGAIDDAHPTLADASGHPVRTEGRGIILADQIAQHLARCRGHAGCLEAGLRLGSEGEQLTNLGAKGCVGSALAVEHRLALMWRELPGREKELLDSIELAHESSR